jgi:hypothetical protein
MPSIAYTETITRSAPEYWPYAEQPKKQTAPPPESIIPYANRICCSGVSKGSLGQDPLGSSSLTNSMEHSSS